MWAFTSGTRSSFSLASPLREEDISRAPGERSLPSNLVEHDVSEIGGRHACGGEGCARRRRHRRPQARRQGITNQREIVVAWDRDSGEPLHRAIVWQDRRTAGRCAELKEQGYEARFREAIDLVLDPCFSGTKIG
jgi:glycerol kinase